jgi:uncharacterized membrane protein
MTATREAPPARWLTGERGQVGDGRNISDLERWVSLIGGSALALYGLSRRSRGGLALAAAGGVLVARGVTQRSLLYSALGVDTAHGELRHGSVIASILPARTVEIERSVTISRPRAELFRFWRDFENLPRFMEHLESVTNIDDTRSHWVAKAPLGRTVEWEAEITDEIENELIAWQSTQRADIENAGSVRFLDAPGGRGTEVKVNLRYEAPGGMVGATFAKIFGEAPEEQVREDLRHFKQIMEVGETPTTAGQPSGAAERGRDQ